MTSGLFAAFGFGLTLVLILHSLWIFNPQITQLRRKIADPKYAGTAHLEKLRYCFNRLHRRAVQLRIAILVLAALSVGMMCL